MSSKTQAWVKPSVNPTTTATKQSLRRMSCLQSGLQFIKLAWTHTAANNSRSVHASSLKAGPTMFQIGTWLMRAGMISWRWRKGWWSTMTTRSFCRRSGNCSLAGTDALTGLIRLRMIRRQRWASCGHSRLIRRPRSTSSTCTWSKTIGKNRRWPINRRLIRR